MGTAKRLKIASLHLCLKMGNQIKKLDQTHPAELYILCSQFSHNLMDKTAKAGSFYDFKSISVDASSMAC